ncbi:uncharacterized protein BDV17DRAFT_277879 [Aspergillus undulatus]|uniref:uncharacterized protein n=1 Tax=Aspergillus undulatus TaxID=1810928 RepID=UPI003CCDA9FD
MVEVAWNRNCIPDTRASRTISVASPMPHQSQIVASRFEACASTASLFLYAQGSAILCLHHDTLALERRFENHKEDILFISVDNVSERGAGRLVLSYDASKTAIIWDLFTGSVIARFASFEELKAASWMKDGNVAFGNEKGDVILFEPSTSDNVSCRTIFDPITALAPAADCRTYAIGYQNGSILIATLLPTFTILHTMTTSRGPSPIVSLAWHASSSKQKSDMLATMAANGDLRVWSVAKPPGKEAPRVIRVLKRSDLSSTSEPKWMGWSKNGKIIQYLDGETWAWDVKTKHITYEPIPTIDSPLGIANYGPTAALFTLGPQYTVQQYDLDNPAMVANVQHPPTNSMSAALDQMRARTKSGSPRALQDPPEMRESGSSYSSRRRAPFDSSGIEAVRQQRAELSSPESSRGRAASVSSKASSDKYKPPFSPPTRSAHTATSFSLTSAGGGRETPQPYAYASSISMSSAKSSRPGSRLRNEVQFSPADKNVDLFPFTRARLNDVPYRSQQPLDEHHLTPDILRRQMLSMVFGWDGDIEGLIKDELYRHPPGSAAAILLAQWIDESDTDHMASMISVGPQSMGDWMLLALSQMNGQSQANKVGQAFVQKLLELGDVHSAATILIGLGDRDDAIEVYVSQNYYMEAILMTALVMPTDWQRQSYLVRRWGEHVVAHSQQQLAIRCFMCTGVEPSDPWASPAVHQANFGEVIPGRSPVGSPEPGYASAANILHANNSVSANRQSLKAPPLKLITSFDGQPSGRFRFASLKSDDRTPTNAPGVTPIAESAAGSSAMSPGGFGSYKLNNIQSLNNAMNSRSGTPLFPKQRLPSIGETPVDVHPPTFLFKEASKKLVDYGSTSENEDTSMSETKDQNDDLGLLPSATYDPEEGFKPSPQTAVQATSDKFATIKGLPSPSPGIFEALRERSDSRMSGKDRRPDGLHLSLLPGESSHDEQPNTGDSLAASYRSGPSTANSFTTKSPSVSGRSIDQYINSLDEASYYSRKISGHRTRGRRNTGDSTTLTATKVKSRNPSNDTRGRNEKRYVQTAKRSPSSPVPMSPEELAHYSAKQNSKARSTSRVRKPRSRNSSERRQGRSRSRNPSGRADTSEQANRGRSTDRQGVRNESPPSPVPLTNPEDALRFVAGDRERRHQRSRSRRPSGSRREASADGRRTRGTSRTRQEPDTNDAGEQLLSAVAYQAPAPAPVSQTPKDTEARPESQADSLPAPMMSPAAIAEIRRKELAAAELEARRLSLARNPSAPNIPFPGEIQYTRGVLESPSFPMQSFTPRTPGRTMIPPKASPEYPDSSDSNSSRAGVPLGLPATPRAMRHPKYGGAEEPMPPPPPPPPPSAPPATDTAPLLLSDARYSGEAERIPRSMSVPVPEVQPPSRPADMPLHPHFNPNLPRSRSSDRSKNAHHRRQSSRELSTANTAGNYNYGSSPVTVNIEEAMEKAMPPILPELQHLNNNTPPPPPPIPASVVGSGPASHRESSGTIDIAIDNGNFGPLIPRSVTAGPALSINTNMGATSPTEARPALGRRMSLEHRRNRSVNESFSSKIRNLTRRSSRGSDAWGSPTGPTPTMGFGERVAQDVGGGPGDGRI